MSLDVTVRKGEPMERALRRLKNALIVEGLFVMCALRYFEKPSQAKRRKKRKS